MSPDQETLIAPHLLLEERIQWNDGVPTNIGGTALKTKARRRVRRPTSKGENDYVYYLVDCKPWRSVFSKKACSA